MSATLGRPQGSHGMDRKQEDYDAFADQCAGKGEPFGTFYPTNGKRAADARKICRFCPVREQCLAYALKYDERYGIWGGLTETDRRVVKRQQKQLAAVNR